MSVFKTWHLIRKAGLLVTLAVSLYLAISIVVRTLVPPHDAVAIEFPTRSTESIQFFNDESWIDEHGARQLSQSLFSALFDGIKAAKSIIVVDMFLFNSWQGPIPETHRMLASELTSVLVEQKRLKPEMEVIVISDPINTVYGGLQSAQFNSLKSAGVHVVLTRLEKLQDSNPLWSGMWRWLIRPWGNTPGDLLPNPFGEGQVSVRSYLSLLNFKANHRKLMIADNGGDALFGWVSSANPHDGSSAHRNIAVRFGGRAALDLLSSERALLEMNEAHHLLPMLDEVAAKAISALTNSATNNAEQTSHVQVVSESKIHDAIIKAIDNADPGADINLAMFYLSERDIVNSLVRASQRDVRVRVLLDVNNDAFGRRKNGVPNRPVAAELVQAGVTVRWCATLGEQCHAKWLHVSSVDSHEFFIGSANFTRRNLMDLNLETDVRIVTPQKATIANEMIDYFERQWSNDDDRQFSAPYERYADDSIWLKLQYRVMEQTGLSTF